MNAVKTNQKGFSIIEVVLVLAIAGLIFLMVFVALPALQRSQRDTGRRNDVGVVVSAVNSYASNNRGALPANTTRGLTDLRSYVGDLSQYTSGNVRFSTNNTQNPGTSVLVHLGRQCGTGDNMGEAVPGTVRQAAIRVQLESGSGRAVYCQSA